jgi:hypothetical protein
VSFPLPRVRVWSRWAFWLEAPFMLPLAVLCFFIPNRLKRKDPVDHSHGHAVKAIGRMDTGSPDAEPLLLVARACQ